MSSARGCGLAGGAQGCAVNLAGLPPRPPLAQSGATSTNQRSRTMGTFASILAPSDNLNIRVIRAQPYHKPTFMGLLRSMLSCFPNLRKWDAESQYVNKYKLRNLGPALRGTGWLLVLYMIR